jgi:hypothetical protein
MSANQLMSKALSTDSEDEAIACLVMARKKGLKLGVTAAGKNTTDQLQSLLNKYSKLNRDHCNLIIKFNEREQEGITRAYKLNKQISWTRKTAVIAVILSVMITAAVVNSISNNRIKALQAEINQMELVPCQTIFCVIGRAL